jgi:hypothetical protein
MAMIHCDLAMDETPKAWRSIRKKEEGNGGISALRKKEPQDLATQSRFQGFATFSCQDF